MGGRRGTGLDSDAAEMKANSPFMDDLDLNLGIAEADGAWGPAQESSQTDRDPDNPYRSRPHVFAWIRARDPVRTTMVAGSYRNRRRHITIVLSSMLACYWLAGKLACPERTFNYGS